MIFSSRQKKMKMGDRCFFSVDILRIRLHFVGTFLACRWHCGELIICHLDRWASSTDVMAALEVGEACPPEPPKSQCCIPRTLARLLFRSPWPEPRYAQPRPKVWDYTAAHLSVLFFAQLPVMPCILPHHHVKLASSSSWGDPSDIEVSFDQVAKSPW
jgi:hypothetical protein